MISIIGGSGFVGTKLITELNTKNCHNYDKNESLYYNKITTKCDIRNELSLMLNSKTSSVVLLAAEHRDDVTPTSLYYDVNLDGTKNVLKRMDEYGIKNLIFTSSVAIYGLNKINPGENHPKDPFNHYGKSKWEAELAIKKWYQEDPENKSVTIIRPTVIFGEKNRGNVYNLLRQIASGKFLMIGKGQNKKSMAYVDNVVAFIKYRLELNEKGFHVFNYVDKPDLTISSLIIIINKALNKKTPSIKLPIWVGFLAGYFFDLIAFLTKKKLPVSSVRIKKFISTTQFDGSKAHSSGFKPPFTLEEGLKRTLKYEFFEKRSKNDEVFYSE